MGLFKFGWRQVSQMLRSAPPDTKPSSPAPAPPPTFVGLLYEILNNPGKGLFFALLFSLSLGFLVLSLLIVGEAWVIVTPGSKIAAGNLTRLVLTEAAITGIPMAGIVISLDDRKPDKTLSLLGGSPVANDAMAAASRKAPH
jgi:hypothetical protein